MRLWHLNGDIGDFLIRGLHKPTEEGFGEPQLQYLEVEDDVLQTRPPNLGRLVGLQERFPASGVEVEAGALLNSGGKM